jgi:hypothetical protein
LNKITKIRVDIEAERISFWQKSNEQKSLHQSIPQFFNKCLNFSPQHIKSDVDDHNRPVNNTLDIIVELVETGSDVLSSAELNQLQAEGKRLRERYDFVSDNTDKLLRRMLAAMEELGKFRAEMTSFRTWMDKAYKVLEDKERQLANLNKLQGNADEIKAFVSDVMTHGADLKFLTISGQKFIDLSKVSLYNSPSVSMFVCLSVSLCVCLSFCLSVSLSLTRPIQLLGHLKS